MTDLAPVLDHSAMYCCCCNEAFQIPFLAEDIYLMYAD